MSGGIQHIKVDGLVVPPGNVKEISSQRQGWTIGPGHTKTGCHRTGYRQKRANIVPRRPELRFQLFLLLPQGIPSRLNAAHQGGAPETGLNRQ